MRISDWSSDVCSSDLPKGIRDAGSHWHSDYSYKKVTANATLLYALEIPEQGGDTLFADMAAAYAALSDTMKRRLDGLKARHQYRWTRDPDHPEGRMRLMTEQERRSEEHKSELPSLMRN